MNMIKLAKAVINHFCWSFKFSLKFGYNIFKLFEKNVVLM